MNSFGEFSRGGQRCTVELLEPSLLGHSGEHCSHRLIVAEGDAWLRQHLSDYAQWAPAHNSLLIVTWDEDDGSDANHILTLLVGAHVQAGQYAETINHYDVLRTIEALEGVPFTNHAASATTIADIWQP